MVDTIGVCVYGQSRQGRGFGHGGRAPHELFAVGQTAHRGGSEGLTTKKMFPLSQVRKFNAKYAKMYSK